MKWNDLITPVLTRRSVRERLTKTLMPEIEQALWDVHAIGATRRVHGREMIRELADRLDLDTTKRSAYLQLLDLANPHQPT